MGQGDCTVIQCPSRDGNVISIIDAGSKSRIGFNRMEVVNFLRLNEVTINSIFLTHPDEDHINYIDAILDAYNKNVSVYHSCDWTKYTERIRGRITSGHANPEIRVPRCCGQNCSQNQHSRTLCTKSGVRLKVIGSEHTGQNCETNKNGDSIVSTIEYQGVKTLIAGDFEGDEAFVQSFIECSGNDLSADIFRLSHHGADNEKANQRNFSRAINPSFVFSSSGLKANYGHPRCSLYNDFTSGELKLKKKSSLTYTLAILGGL